MGSSSHTQAICCLLVLAVTAGCSLGKVDRWDFAKSMDVRRVIGRKKDDVPEPQTPTRLVSTWTDTTLHRTGEQAERGFGGRLLFFNENAEDAIRVEGQLVVYAYDENGRAAHETHPTRRYVFPADQFVRHESNTNIGPSYSVWIPWDAVGGEQKDISLIARFEPKRGALVVGDQTRHLLPGIRQMASGKTAPTPESISNIRLTQYTQESKISMPKAEKQRVTPLQQSWGTSISLSGKNWEQRLGESTSK